MYYEKPWSCFSHKKKTMVSIDTPWSNHASWDGPRAQRLGLWLVFDFPRWWVGRRQLAPGGTGFSPRTPTKAPGGFSTWVGFAVMGYANICKIYVYGIWQCNIYIYIIMYIFISRQENITWLVLFGFGPPPRTQNAAFWKSQKNLMTIPPKNNPLLKIDFRDKLRRLPIGILRFWRMWRRCCWEVPAKAGELWEFQIVI